ncbi:MAG: tRNA (adenosine(37)-N6)-threonylcarbamoyltransferase complex ATPase subunit type 1 TsaE [Bdellovibrionales bacterium]|nr:tRNA (adenosine(37)-N6)-threonylcarbamoyltransferase complex ATPase subunit type 1 TsaE [Bdellovibrionales bacterium]
MDCHEKEDFLPTVEATERLGQELSKGLKPGDIVKITGTLGVGKTTFARGVIEGLGGNVHEVHSPTFSLVHEIPTPRGWVNHCDFYRLPKESDLEDLGGLELFSSDRIHLVEWLEQASVEKLLDPQRLIRVDLQIDAHGRFARVMSPKKIFD